MANRQTTRRQPSKPVEVAADRRAAARLAAVRLIVLLPVLAVGGVGWWRARRHGGPDLATRAQGRPLLYVFAAAVALAVLGIAFLYLRWRRERHVGERNRLSVLGWSVTEMPGLLGGAYFFVTSDPRPYFGALFLLVLTFMLFPLPGRR
jgi:ABC-type Fe3+ transport system permease subunit